MRFLIWIASLCALPTFIRGQETSLYLNPETALGAKASLFFHNAELIQLQTTKESYFSNIAGFIVTPAHFVFLDDANNAVLIFNNKGQFQFKYKKRRYKIKSIQYVREKNALFIFSENKNYTIPQTKAQQMIQHPGDRNFSKYINLELLSLDNKFDIQALPVTKFALHNIYYFNEKYLVENKRYNKYLKDTIAYHLNVVDGNKIIQSYFPFINIPKLPPYYKDISISVDPTASDSAVFVHKDFDNTVYKLTQDSIFPAYKFVFPAANTMPSDFFSTSFKDNILFTDYIKNHDKVIASYNNMIEHKNLFFFTTVSRNWSRVNYMFNKTNNQLYDLAKITTDTTVYFLPQKIFEGIAEEEGDYLYTTISNADLLKEKATIQSKNTSMPAEMKLIFEGLNKFNNPVVIRLTTNNIAAQ